MIILYWLALCYIHKFCRKKILHFFQNLCHIYIIFLISIFKIRIFTVSQHKNVNEVLFVSCTLLNKNFKKLIVFVLSFA
jgi:hypothetical protein